MTVSVVPGSGEESHKQRLLAYASGRFMSEGFAGISVGEICRDLGMSKKTFYQVFAGKDELVATLMEGMLARLTGEIDRIMSGPEPFPLRIHQMMTLMGTTIGNLGKPFLRDVERHAPALWERVQAIRRERIQAIFLRLVEEGKREGSIRPDVDTRVLLMSYLGAVEAVIVPGVLALEQFSAREALRSILTIFFLGALTEESAAQLRSLVHHST